MLAISTFSDHPGSIQLSEPFRSAYPETMFAAYMVPIGAIAMGAIVRVLYWHRRAWVGFGVFLMLALFFTTLEYTIGFIVNRLAIIGNFLSPTEMPADYEMIHRLKFFAAMSVIAAMGLVPGVWLGRLIEKSTERKFRKIRKKIRQRRAYDD